jgi:predicted AAA+ superfamily ATPase
MMIGAVAVRLTPYPANLSKRLVRTPKVYFLDVGLAAHLQGWRNPKPRAPLTTQRAATVCAPVLASAGADAPLTP